MIATTCDYCGQSIDDDEMHVMISVNGQVPSDRLCGWEHEGGYVGHYHSSEREDGEPACYWRLRDAIDLVREWAGTLAELPVQRAKATPLGYRDEDQGGER